MAQALESAGPVPVAEELSYLEARGFLGPGIELCPLPYAWDLTS